MTTPRTPEEERAAVHDPVPGYIYTHADCPHCEEPGDYEGDRSHEEVRCTACGETFTISHVL